MGKPDLNALYRRCLLCPRACAVDRTSGAKGFCREGAAMRAAWAGLHFGEEPPITGLGGSGTVFFAGCTLKCRFCQNDQLSHRGLGRELSSEQLARLMLELQKAGAENINLVTGSHFAPGIVETAAIARERGLAIPLLWNSSGYESLQALELLEPWIDVYLPDCKTLDPEVGRRFMGAPDYPDAVRQALPAMAGKHPLQYKGDRLIRGVIVRHLVLPEHLSSTRQVLEWFSRTLQGKALLSVMLQYTPNERAAGKRRLKADAEAGGLDGRAAAPHRRVSGEEYAQVLAWLEELGIEDGFIQEPEPDSDWLPDFERPNPFPEAQARPVWHCRDGPPV